VPQISGFASDEFRGAWEYGKFDWPDSRLEGTQAGCSGQHHQSDRREIVTIAEPP
jgi:hypothetical protein